MSREEQDLIRTLQLRKPESRGYHSGNLRAAGVGAAADFVFTYPNGVPVLDFRERWENRFIQSLFRVSSKRDCHGVEKFRNPLQ